MSSIDERVVQMKFDNSQFQKGVSETNSSLDSLKKGLNLDASVKSLEGLDAAGKKFSLAGMASGIETIASKFGALSVIGITALTNITNKAVDAGLQFAKSFTVAPIMDGFNEYELKMGSIQTILANTAKDGTTLKDVSAALEELNTYADKTIYNFGDMTRNIGLFTNAGIKLQDATDMIKGFSNEAAMSGTTSAAASGAAYQLSQALSKGKITLEDWRSLTNAGMGNKNMQTGIIDIATAMGTFKGKGIEAKDAAKDFNGTLEKGWLTADVMQNYLKIQAGEMSVEQMKGLKLTDAQIENFVKMQKIAEEAATKVRTWSQLVGTLKEAVGSSWSTTWELLIGNFDDATALFTEVSNTLGDMIGKTGEARNNLIKGWVDLGGRTAIIDSLRNVFNTLLAVMKPIGEAFKEIFPPMTADTLLMITNRFKAFTESLKPSPATLDLIKRTFKGVFAVVDIGWLIIQKLWTVFEKLFKGMDGGGTSLLGITAKIGDFLVKVRDTLVNSEKLNQFFMRMGDAIASAVRWFTEIIKKVSEFIQNFKGIHLDTSGFTGAIDNLRNSLGQLKPTGDMITKLWDGLINVFKKGLEIGQQMAGKLGEAFKGIGSGMQDASKGINFNSILGIIGSGLLAGIVVMIKKFMKMIKGAIEEIGKGPSIIETIKDSFGALTDTLSAMQTTLKASTLILIAGAIALLTLSVVELSKVDANKLPAVLGAITVMFGQLSIAMAVLSKINFTGGLGNLVAIGGTMILLAFAINILADAVGKLGKMDWQTLIKGLIGVTALLGGLAGAMRLLPKNPTGMIATGVGMIALAVAIKILASAVGDFAGMDWQKMMQGLIGVGLVLGGLALFTQLAKVNKGAIASSAGLILLGVAIKIMASAVSDFADMDPKTIQQGLGALGLVLGMLAGFTRAVDPQGMIRVGIAMVILGGAMKIMYSVLTDFATIAWEPMGRGLVAMGGALALITASMNLMPKNMLVKAAALVVVGAALKIIASAFKDMGGMSWDEIGRGFTVLAGALALLVGAMYLMSGALAGAAAMLIVAGALAILAPVLKLLGGMSWDEIGRGLVILAGALAIIAGAGYLMAPVVVVLIGLGVAVSLLGLGMVLAGVGLLAFAVGLTALAAAGAAASTVLIAIVTGLLGLIPYGFTQIGLGLVAFAQVIGDHVTVFVDLGVKLLTGLLDGLKQVAPVILNFLADMLFLLLDTIANNIQRFVDAGLRILIGFLDGIANNMDKVITSATNIIVNYINGIANNLDRVIAAGANLLIKFIEGISNQFGPVADAAGKAVIKFVNAAADAINNNRQAMEAAGSKLGWAIVDGMTGGLASKVKDVASSAWEMGKTAIETIKRAIDSNSPSKETFKLGEYAGQGFALGITKLVGKVATAGTGIGKAALTAMQATISSVGSELDGNMNINPVIKPVLDLSSVRKDAGLIDGMIQPGVITLDSTYAKAAVISAEARVAQEAQAAAQEQAANSVPADRQNVIFNQYNTSPKALAPVDIYRSTKNQLSVAKGALIS